MSIKKILISQPQPDAGKSPYTEVATKYGVDITYRSFIKIESVSPREFRDQRINILEHSAIIFTTRKAMEHFFQLTTELRIAIPETMKYFCLSEQIANYLQKFTVFRKRKIFYPAISNLDALVALITKHSKETYFIPCPEEHKTDLQNMLTVKKIQHSTGIMFRTVPALFGEEEKQELFDLYIFFTPIGVQSLKINYPDFEQGDIKIGAFGPATAKAIEEAGLRLDLAPSPEAPSMVAALELYLSKVTKKGKK